MFKRLLSSVALVGALILPVSGYAQTALSETSLSAAVTSSQTFVTVASASGAVAGGGLYVGREYMSIADSYTTGTRIPVLRRGAAVSHAASEPVWIGPAAAFVNGDRDGSCVAAAQPYLPLINVSNGKIWDCGGAKKWVNVRDLVVVTCRALLVADQIDQSCYTADRPYVVHKITYVHTTPESAGTLTVVPRKQVGTQAAASGTALATAINAVASGTAAQTVVTATLATNEANLILGTGDRLGLDYTDDTAGELAGVTVTFYLYAL